MFKFFDKVKKSKVGYTLTELIVVVAILGILAAVGIPMIMNARGDAEKKADAASISAIEQAVQLALAEDKLHTTTAGVIDSADATITSEVKARLIGKVFPDNNASGGKAWYLDKATGKVYDAQNDSKTLAVLN